MQAVRWLHELRHYTQQLSGAARRRRTILGAGSSAVKSRQGSQPHLGDVEKLNAVREKLLMRRLPIALSRTERALSHIQRRTRQTSSLSRTIAAGDVSNATPLHSSMAALALPRDTTQSSSSSTTTHGRDVSRHQELLRMLHTMEHERRQLLEEKRSQRHEGHQRAQGALQQFLEEFPSRSLKTLSHEDAAMIKQSREQLQERVSDASEDLKLLEASLLTRPFLTAKMWRLVLQEEMWVQAVQQQRRIAAGEHVVSQGQQRQSLLVMSLCLARLSLGALRDYVQGSEVAAHAPRFAVSIPSAAWRRKLQESEAGIEAQVETEASPADDAHEEDPLMMMMVAGSAKATDAPLQHQGRRDEEKEKTVARVRWIPSHSADVMPLVDDTLALFSFIVPELPVEQSVRDGHAEEVLSLLCILQKMASASLALRQGRTNADDSNDAAREAAYAESLRRLDAAMLTCARGITLALVECVQEGALPTLDSAKAASLIIELNALGCLQYHRRECQGLLDALVGCVYPELRTSTTKTLQEKSRHTSFFAYASRKHRAKLLQQHGSVAGAESYLHESVIQQARLRQRMMSAALRERHLSQAHSQVVSNVGSALPLCDLVTLLQVLVRSLTAAGPRHHDASMRSAASNSGKIAASLSTVEAILSHTATQKLQNGLDIEHSTRMWVVLNDLWPLVDARRELIIQNKRHGGATMRKGSSAEDAKAETIILTFGTESVLHSINATLAERLRGIEQQHRSSSRAQRNSPTSDQGALTGQQVSIIAAGLSQWHESSPHCRRSATLAQQVQMTTKLLKELVMQDAQLRAEVRAWPLDKREEFNRIMSMGLQTGEAENTTTRLALQKMCALI